MAIKGNKSLKQLVIRDVRKKHGPRNSFIKYNLYYNTCCIIIEYADFNNAFFLNNTT